MPDPQIQSRLDRLRLKESIAQFNDPEAFLLEASEILRELGNSTKHAKLAEKDPFLAVSEPRHSLCQRDRGND